VAGFGRNGVFLPACATTFAPALQRVADEAGQRVSGCLSAPPAVTAESLPDCSATLDGAPLPVCDAAGTTPCLSLLPNPMCVSQFSVALNGNPPGPLTLAVRCRTAGAGAGPPTF